MTTPTLDRVPQCARASYIPPADLPSLPIYGADVPPLAGAMWAAAETVETLHPVVKAEPSDWLVARDGAIWLHDPYNGNDRQVRAGDVVELLWTVRLENCCEVEFCEDGTIVAPMGAALGNAFWLDYGLPVHSLEAYRREVGSGDHLFIIDAWSEKIRFRVLMSDHKARLERA